MGFILCACVSKELELHFCIFLEKPSGIPHSLFYLFLWPSGHIVLEITFLECCLAFQTCNYSFLTAVWSNWLIFVCTFCNFQESSGSSFPFASPFIFITTYSFTLCIQVFCRRGDSRAQITKNHGSSHPLEVVRLWIFKPKFVDALRYCRRESRSKPPRGDSWKPPWAYSTVLAVSEEG